MKLCLHLAQLAANGYLVRIERHPANTSYIVLTLSKDKWSRRAFFNFIQWKENDILDALKKLESSFSEFEKVQQQLEKP